MSKREKGEKAEIISGVRRRYVVRVRKLFCQISVCEMGNSGVEVDRFFGVSTSVVNCLAGSEDLPECHEYLNKLFWNHRYSLIPEKP